MKHNARLASSSMQQATPLALIFTSRLLLTEKSSVTEHGFVLSMKTKSLAMSETLPKKVPIEHRGYNHFGIND